MTCFIQEIVKTVIRTRRLFFGTPEFHLCQLLKLLELLHTLQCCPQRIYGFLTLLRKL